MEVTLELVLLMVPEMFHIQPAHKVMKSNNCHYYESRKQKFIAFIALNFLDYKHTPGTF